MLSTDSGDPPADPPADPTAGPEGLSADLFGHWLDLCADSPAGDGLPVRAQVDMLTLPVPTLPWFFLHERVESRYRSLIAGTRLASSLGFEPKGRFLDEVMTPAVYADRRAVFDTCLDTGRSFFYRGALSKPTDRHVAFCRLLLPLHREADGPVDMLCGMLIFLEKAGLSERDRRWIDGGFTGLFDCLWYEADGWRNWTPDQASAKTIALR